MIGASMPDYPIEIEDRRASGVLCLTWADGSVSALAHSLLRSHCRCAQCQQAQRSTGEGLHVDAAIRLTDIRCIADKALNLVFSDEHDKGIYPWAYLKEIGEDAPVQAA